MGYFYWENFFINHWIKKLVKISSTKNKEWVNQASILSQALPFMQRYTGKNITIKYGGAAMGDGPLSASFAKDVTLL